jgi:drug/metabolite transporter (DMT)-like permease
LLSVVTNKKGFVEWTLVAEEEVKANPWVGSLNSQPKKEQRSIWRQVSSYGILFVLSTIWGIAFVAIRRADFELSPINLALLRWFVAGAGFLVIAPFIGKPKTKLERQDLPRLLVISLLNVPFYHLPLNFAEKTVSSGLAGFLMSLGPVFIAVFSAYFLKEKIGGRLVLALTLGIMGALVLSVSDLNFSSGGSIAGPLGVVVAALSFATFSVLSKPLVHKYGAATVTIWAGLTGTIMLLPLLSSSFVAEVTALSMTGWFSILYLSLLSTVVGYLMFYTLVSRGAVSRLSIQLYLIPLISVVGGVLLLQESLNVYIIIGGAILLLSIALATGSRN